MKNAMKVFAITAATLLLASSLFAGEPLSEDGRQIGARLAAHKERVQSTVRIPVTIDLTGVIVNTTPAVLGAYLLRADFDPTLVKFVGAKGGSTIEFSAAPMATDAEKANGQGWVKIVAVQPNMSTPVGKVSVATLEFEEIVPGGASSIKTVIEQLAAQPAPDGNGDMSAALEIPIEPQAQ